MAKRHKKPGHVLLGADTLTIIMVTLGFVFLISKYFDIKKDLKDFHQTVFNTHKAINKFSVSIDPLAFEINSFVTSKPFPNQEKFEDYPFLAEPITYNITHFITPLSHHGQVHIKLSENANLTGFFSEDIRATFYVAVNKNITFNIEKLHYQTLLKEVILGKVNGNVNFNGNSQLSIQELSANMNHLNFKSNDLRVEYNNERKELWVKTPELKMNNQSITDV